MYKKLLTVSAISLVLSGCGSSNPDDIEGKVKIVGEAAYGSTLTAQVTDANGLSGASITYKWRAGTNTIPGATGPTYTLTKEEINKTISVRALYQDNDGYFSEIASAHTNPVPIVNFTGELIIEGTAQQSQTLTAVLMDDNDFDPTSVTYTWYADDAIINGEISKNLLVSREMIGAKIKASAKYIDRQSYDESVASVETAAVIKIDNTPGEVTITGGKTNKVITQVGQQLKANYTDVNGESSDSNSVSYIWLSDGQVITGENTNIYTLQDADVGKKISATISYIDAEGFEESPTSEPTETIIARPAGQDNEGKLTYSQITPIVGTEISVDVSDSDGLPTEINYQWFIDETVVSTTASYLPATEDKGKELKLIVDYTDNIGFATVLEDTIDIVFTKVVTNSNTLVTAIAEAVEGDYIGMAPGDYANPGILTIKNQELTISRTADAFEAQESDTSLEKAAITGQVCIHVEEVINTEDSSEAGVTLSKLLFNEFDRMIGDDIPCHTAGKSIIRIDADHTTLAQNLFLNDAISNNSINEVNWIVLRGSDTVISRNSFIGKNTAKADLKQAVILAYAPKDGIEAGTFIPQNYLIEYNYFSDFFIGSNAGRGNDSSAIRLGHATSQGNRTSNSIIRYNLFDEVDSRLRLIRIASNQNKIYANTSYNSGGGIALEFGENNNASFNIIIGDTQREQNDTQQAGIQAGPYGHTVSNNYIVGLLGGGYERAGFVLEAQYIEASNLALTKAPTKFTNNSIINTTTPITYGNNKSRCMESTELPVYLGELSNNLVANQFAAAEKSNELTQTSTPVWDRGIIRHDCTQGERMSVTFSNEHYYADIIVGGNEGPFAVTGENVVTDIAAAAEVTVNQDGYVIYSGESVNVGADTSKLYRIKTSDVGVGSEWEWSITLPGLND